MLTNILLFYLVLFFFDILYISEVLWISRWMRTLTCPPYTPVYMCDKETRIVVSAFQGVYSSHPLLWCLLSCPRSSSLPSPSVTFPKRASRPIPFTLHLCSASEGQEVIEYHYHRLPPLPVHSSQPSSSSLEVPVAFRPI